MTEFNDIFYTTATSKRELLQDFRVVESRNAIAEGGEPTYEPRLPGFRRLWDTWVGLGGNKATDKTRFFAEGMLYLVSDIHLKNYLVYCKKELTVASPIVWEDYKVADYDMGELTYGNGIVSAEFDLLLTGEEMEATALAFQNESEPLIEQDTSELIPTPINPNYIPFEELKGRAYSSGLVQISEDDYARCIECLGYPFVQEDELEYDRETIIRMAIRPALERYFKYFPKTLIQTYPVTGNTQDEVFPTDAYAVIHFSVQQGRNVPSGVAANPLLRYFDEMQFMGGMGAGITGNYHGINAPKTQTETMSNFISSRAAQQAVINYRTRAHWDTYQDNRNIWHIRFYSNKMGLAEVHYAIRTNNFNDVEFARKPELYKLCNAEVKKLFGNLRRQIKSDLPGVVDYGAWLTEADTEIKEVEENWKSIVKYSSIIRGSL